MSQARRVVITGMGVVSPLGSDLEEFWRRLTGGESGIDRVTHFDVTEYDCQIAGEVRGFEPAKWFKVPKDTRRTDRFTQLAMAASKLAMSDAGLAGAVEDPER